MNPKFIFLTLSVSMSVFQCKKKEALPTILPIQEQILKQFSIPDYWKKPEIYQWGREEARSDFRPVEFEGLALSNQFTGSKYYQSINGFWKYRFFTGPDYVPANIEKNPANTSWLDISMPGFAELKGMGKPIFKSYSLPFKNDFPNVPSDTNSVLILKKSIDIPVHWADRDIYAVFEGVSTSYFLYVNGEIAGYNEDTKSMSEFKINKLVKPGLNELTLVLIRYTDGSYFESHNQWLLTGLNRNAYLLARPKIMIQDFFAQSNVQSSQGNLKIQAEIKNNSDIIQRDYKLETRLIDDISKTTLSQLHRIQSIDKNNITTLKLNLHLNSVNSWSDEIPSTYTLLLVLKNNNDSVVEATSAKIAFTSISYSNQLLINNKALKLKGVVCNEFHPINGNILDKAWIDNDMDVMKLHKINAIRNNHYPFDSYWYQSAAQYGLWIMDECNLNLTYLQQSGKDYSMDSSLADVYLQRVKNTFERNKNHGNIMSWSLGYNTGQGPNITNAYHYIKKRDSKRPVVLCNQHSSYGDLNMNNDSDSRKPNLLYTMANNQGNGCGGIDQLWSKVLKNPTLQGGFVEEFTDQCFYMKNKAGQLFFGYGGVFGETQSDSFQCVKGLLTSNKIPNPSLKNIANLFSTYTIESIDLSKGDFIIQNNSYYYEGENYNYFWIIDENSEKIKEGKFDKLFIKAGQSKKIHVPIETITKKPGKEYCIILQVEKIVNHKGMYRFLTEKIQKFCLPVEGATTLNLSNYADIQIQSSESKIKFALQDGSLSIDKKSGLIDSWIVKNKSLIKTPIKPIFHRAITDLDLIHSRVEVNNFWQKLWNSSQVQDQKINDTDKKKIMVQQKFSFTNSSGLSCILNYTIMASNDIVLEIDMTNNDKDIPKMPRISWTYNMETGFGTFQWYGKGPYESYPDRKNGFEIGLYKNSISDLNVPRIRPQEMANRSEVRWVELSSFDSYRVCVTGSPYFDCKALPFEYSDLEGKFKNGIDLKPSSVNSFMAGYELWPLDDFKCEDLLFKQGETIQCKLRFHAYQSDISKAFDFFTQKLD